MMTARHSLRQFSAAVRAAAKIATASLLFIRPAPALAQQPQKISLADALQMAERQNLDLVAARAQRAVAAAGVQIAKERPNPTANLNVLRDDPHEGWWFDQPVDLSGKRKHRIELAQAQGALTDDDISALERQTRENARDLFFTLALARRTATQKDDALKLAQRLHDIAQARFQTGDVPQLEVFQADLVVSQAQADDQVAQQEEKIALSDFNTLLNEPASTDWDLQTPLDNLPGPLVLGDLLKHADNANPELQKISQQEKVEQTQRAFLKAERIPNLVLSAGVDYSSPHNFRYGPRSQASMEIPLFSRNQGEIAESSATLVALEDQAQATRRSVEGRVESAYLDLQTREDQARLYQTSLVPAADKLEGLAEDSYRAGKENILYVLEAQKNIQAVRQEYLQSLFAVHQAFAQLEEIVGTPLD
ncbi:MAG TPA: TolC family protein [Candidatus Acidoferrales bacterium]|nr:TolC family protein [Candidatus Acidoferrales bacterium]